MYENMDPQTAALMQQGAPVMGQPPQGMPQGMDPQTAALMQPGANVMGGAPTAPAAPGQLDPALIKQILSLNAQAPRQAQAQRAFSMADKLRAGAPAMGKSQSSISTPNWAGTLAGVLANYKAGQEEKRGDAIGQELAGERQKAYSDFMGSYQGQ